MATLEEKYRQAGGDTGIAVRVSLFVNRESEHKPDAKNELEFLAGKSRTPDKPGLKIHNAYLLVYSFQNEKRAQIFGLFDQAKLAKLVP